MSVLDAIYNWQLFICVENWLVILVTLHGSKWLDCQLQGAYNYGGVGSVCVVACLGLIELGCGGWYAFMVSAWINTSLESVV